MLPEIFAKKEEGLFDLLALKYLSFSYLDSSFFLMLVWLASSFQLYREDSY